MSAAVAKQVRVRRHAMLINVANEEGVERAGMGKAPSAFRIWRAGENRADDGSIFFTEESAQLLMSEQISRDRIYSIDFDHLSLMNNRPAEAGRAAGWHRLDVRPNAEGKPELWAVDVEWCTDVRDGLEENPPRWRFFSPAFVTDESGEVASYLNLALCINPMTHGIPVLASRKERKEASMTTDEMLSQLDALIEATQDPDQKAALVAAREALSSKKSDEGEGTEEVVTDAEKKDDDEGEKKKDDDEDEEKKSVKEHAHKSDAAADMAAENVALRQRMDRLEINAALEKRKDLTEAVRKWCMSEDPAVVRRFLGKVDKVHSVQRAPTPTKGNAKPGDDLDPGVAEAMDAAMGLGNTTPKWTEKRPDGSRVYHNIRPRDLARLLAQKGQA